MTTRNDAWRSVACEICGAAAGANCVPLEQEPARNPMRRSVVDYCRRAFAAGSMNCAGGARDRAYIAADPVLSSLPPAAERLQAEPKPRVPER